jgi:hypothetical protein
LVRCGGYFIEKFMNKLPELTGIFCHRFLKFAGCEFEGKILKEHTVSPPE